MFEKLSNSKDELAVFFGGNTCTHPEEDKGDGVHVL